MTGVIVTREKVRQRAGAEWCLQELDGGGMPLGEVLTEIAKLIAIHGEHAILQTEAVGSCGTCDSDLDEVELATRVWVERDETDAELARREGIELRRLQNEEAQARRDYERLRKRFEVPPAPEPAPPPVVGAELSAGMRETLASGLSKAISQNVDDAKPGSAP